MKTVALINDDMIRHAFIKVFMLYLLRKQAVYHVHVYTNGNQSLRTRPVSWMTNGCSSLGFHLDVNRSMNRTIGTDRSI